jgi:hypothetical protein
MWPSFFLLFDFVHPHRRLRGSRDIGPLVRCIAVRKVCEFDVVACWMYDLGRLTIVGVAKTTKLIARPTALLNQMPPRRPLSCSYRGSAVPPRSEGKGGHILVGNVGTRRRVG